MIEIRVTDPGLTAALTRITRGLHAPAALMAAIAQTLADQAELNFAAQGRPKWLGLAPRTRARRGADARILQDTGRLAGSIASDHGTDYARVGSNVAYAAIHQLGGDIERAAHSRLVSHRGDGKGGLLRTKAFGGRGLVFARPGSRGSVDRWFGVAAHRVHIPARPYLPVLPDGSLQPEAREAVESDVSDWLRGLIGGA